MKRTANSLPGAAELRRQAEDRLKAKPAGHGPAAGPHPSDGDAQRLLHELQVHQIEVEMQNAELQEARERTESLLEKYTDLYDFAPVGYFSVDEQGLILEVNLTGAAMLGVERSHLVQRRLQGLIVPASRPIFRAFLDRVLAEPATQVCEVSLEKKDGAPFWAALQGTSAVSLAARKWCRVAVSDITVLKGAEEARQRLEALAITNRELQREIVRRKTVEEALRKSEQHQIQLLEQSQHMQEQLRRLSHQMLQAQEEERKRISRELHDEIAQTLMGISVHLETLVRGATVNPRSLKRKFARTQRLVAKSVDIVHRFAQELRPPLLDDLGLIATLHSLMKEFAKRTRVRVRFTTFAGVEQLPSATRTVLYRVVQSALANVARHAEASRVEVSIRKHPDLVRMEIKDNGKSFDVERVLRAKNNQRLGLLGMRERVEMVGGDFSVESAPGQGTTIRAEIPFSNSPVRENAAMLSVRA